MNIFNADLTKLVSQSFLEDEKAKQICEVINTELQSLMANVHFAESAYDVDNATEAVLEHIAWQLNSELFFLGSTLEEKKRLVKEAIKLHRRKGTKYAVEHAIQLIIPTATVSEWFEYDGNPYHFRVLNADRRTLKEILTIISLINIMKSLRSWIDNEFIAIDEGLIDLNLLLDMDILMTSKHSLDYIRGMSFLYPTVYNESEIIDSEEILYNELNLTSLFNQFLIDNNLDQTAYNVLVSQYKTDYLANNSESFNYTVIDGKLVKIYESEEFAYHNIRNDYEQLLETWISTNNYSNISTPLNNRLSKQITQWNNFFITNKTEIILFNQFLTDNNLDQTAFNVLIDQYKRYSIVDGQLVRVENKSDEDAFNDVKSNYQSLLQTWILTDSNYNDYSEILEEMLLDLILEWYNDWRA